MIHNKLIVEHYPISVDFTNRIRSGQAPSNSSVVVLDSEGVNVTSDIITNSSVGISGNKIVLGLKANGGTVGRTYTIYVRLTTTDDLVEQVITLNIIG